MDPTLHSMGIRRVSHALKWSYTWNCVFWTYFGVFTSRVCVWIVILHVLVPSFRRQNSFDSWQIQKQLHFLVWLHENCLYKHDITHCFQILKIGCKTISRQHRKEECSNTRCDISDLNKPDSILSSILSESGFPLFPLTKFLDFSSIFFHFPWAF